MNAGADVSDLIGVKETLWLGGWIVATLLAFFLIGIVVGIIVLAAGAIASIAVLAGVIKRADTPD